VPCPLHASLTPRGSVTFRTTIRPRNLHPLKAMQSPICTTQSRPMAGHKSQRRNPHPSRRRQRHERLRGKPVAKREMQQFQGFLSSRVPHPHPGHDHPRSPFMFVGHSSTCSGQFLSSRRGCRIGASQRTKVEAHTNMHFFGRSLEAREVMCPCSPGLTGSGAARGLDSSPFLKKPCGWDLRSVGSTIGGEHAPGDGQGRSLEQ